MLEIGLHISLENKFLYQNALILAFKTIVLLQNNLCKKIHQTSLSLRYIFSILTCLLTLCTKV